MEKLQLGRANGNGPLHIIRPSGEGSLCGSKRAHRLMTLAEARRRVELTSLACGRCVYVLGWIGLLGRQEDLTLEHLPKVQVR